MNCLCVSPSDSKYELSNSLFKGFLSKIKRTLRLFDGPTLDGMGVYHRCSHITMAKQLLNRADVIIRLKQMAGKTVAKGSPQTQIPVDGGYLSCWLYRSSYHPTRMISGK